MTAEFGTTTRSPTPQLVVVSANDPETAQEYGLAFARRIHRSFCDVLAEPEHADAVESDLGSLAPASLGELGAAAASARLRELFGPSTPLVVAAPPEALWVCDDPRDDAAAPPTRSDEAGGAHRGAASADLVVLWLMLDGPDATDCDDVDLPTASAVRRVAVDDDVETTLDAMDAALRSVLVDPPAPHRPGVDLAPEVTDSDADLDGVDEAASE